MVSDVSMTKIYFNVMAIRILTHWPHLTDFVPAITNVFFGKKSLQ